MPDRDERAPTFDFEDHRRQAVDAYAKIRNKYQEFAFAVRNILREAIDRKNLKVHSIEARAKSLDSFGMKAIRPSDNDPTEPKYRNPVREITDLAAARVITFFPRTIEEVDARIREQFHVLERVDHTQFLERHERFGYNSVHYLIELKGDRIRLPEYEPFGGLVAEIQVRTVLQHAWAEIEHDIQYKSTVTIPVEIRRRFMALAGLLEIADREFQAIQGSDAKLREEARQSVEKGKFEGVEITPDALRAYLNKKLAPITGCPSFPTNGLRVCCETWGSAIFGRWMNASVLTTMTRLAGSHPALVKDRSQGSSICFWPAWARTTFRSIHGGRRIGSPGRIWSGSRGWATLV